MTKHWPGFGSEQPTVESEATGSGSANGVAPEDSIEVSGGAAEQPAATEENVVATAEDGKTAADAWADAEVGAAAAAVDDASVFLAELVRTLQTTAGLERVRVAEETEKRRQAHIDQIRSRQASEADRMRELAGDDTRAIDAWADGETKRIQVERERRATKRNQDLETSLAEHTSKIDQEIERVETAVAAYRAEVDAFFDGLDHQSDLVLIAKQATRRPIFPALDAVAAVDGGPESPGVGVMDPQAPAVPAESWASPAEANSWPGLAGAFEEADRAGNAADSAEPVPAAVEGSPSESGSLFQSTPVERPMSRSRRDANEGDR